MWHLGDPHPEAEAMKDAVRSVLRVAPSSPSPPPDDPHTPSALPTRRGRAQGSACHLGVGGWSRQEHVGDTGGRGTDRKENSTVLRLGPTQKKAEGATKGQEETEEM